MSSPSSSATLTAGSGSPLNVCLYAGDDANGIDCSYVASNFYTSPEACQDAAYRRNTNANSTCNEARRYARANTRANFESMQRCYADPQSPECARWALAATNGLCDGRDKVPMGCAGYTPERGAIVGDGPFEIPTTNWMNFNNYNWRQ